MNFEAADFNYSLVKCSVASMNRFCDITEKLIKDIAGNSDLVRVDTLDLHLKDDELGKIKKIQNLHLVPNLKILNLSYNNISVIEGLNRLSLLEELNLAENSIRKLENYESLTSLQRLNLSGNQISRIPEGISALKCLQILRCSRNDLSVIQDISYLGDIKTLSSLTIEDNPIMTLEQCIPYTIYCIRSLVTLNNSKVTVTAKENAIKRFSVNEMSQMKDLLSNEVNLLNQPTNRMIVSSSANSGSAVKRIESKYPVVLPPHAAASVKFGASNTFEQQQLFVQSHPQFSNAVDDEESSEDGNMFVQTNRFMPKSSSNNNTGNNSNNNTNVANLTSSSSNNRRMDSPPTVSSLQQSMSR